MAVSSSQRFTRDHPCPICGGYDQMARGKGVRCHGFLSDDSRFAHCARSEQRGHLEPNPKTGLYVHKLQGDCRCGTFHDTRPETQHRRQEPEATYEYCDGAGRLLYQVLRYAGKRFRQRRPDGNGGWIWDMEGVQRVPYCLPELLGADLDAWVFIPEGEEDVRSLRSRGLEATTNSEGAGKWRDELSPYLSGRKVAILVDNDKPGKAHGQDKARKLYPFATVIKVVELPGLPDKGDVSDWLKQGHKVEELMALVEQTPEWTPNLTSNGVVDMVGSEVGGPRRVNAAVLQEEALDPNAPCVEFLPLFGQSGFFVSGFSHLFSGYPKAGKTTLLASAVLEWATRGERVLYLTEEPRAVWIARLRAMPRGWENVELVFALGYDAQRLLSEIQGGSETVVVLDTIRLLRIRDENDNSAINIALTPFVAACRESVKTLILAHHINKAGGEFGTAAAGGHAFLGIVDVGLELLRDPSSGNRRKVKGWGRIVEVPELLYEKQGDELVLLGDPRDVALSEVKEKASEVLTSEWQKTDAVWNALGEPRPSKEQLRKALEALASQGRAERNPPIEQGSKQGATYQWRQNFTSNQYDQTLGSEVADRIVV